jgi:hypothetical protein
MKHGRTLVEYVALVFVVGATSILWWTFAGRVWADASTNALLAGEVVFQIAVLAALLPLFRWGRRSSSGGPPREAETDGADTTDP